ncbi:MAG: DUF58 domain-containing protein [Acidimicrobiales bacterium]
MTGAPAGGRRHRSWPRPRHYFVPVTGALVLLATWAAVAHASGSGWVQAIGAIAGGIAFVGIVAPAAAATRLQVQCVACPRDAVAGELLEIELVANAPLRCSPRRPGGTVTVVPLGRQVKVELTPETRGVLYAVRLRLETAAPFGVLWWSVDRLVSLPGEIQVAPALGYTHGDSAPAVSSDEGEGQPVPAFSGTLRGVRGYQHGDSPRLVHWRATAHTGSLMVRENEQEPDLPVTVVADLPSNEAVAGIAASKALRSVTDLLADGRRVVLETVEKDARVSSLVADARSAGRRLAAAGDNPYRDLDQSQ